MRILARSAVVYFVGLKDVRTLSRGNVTTTIVTAVALCYLLLGESGYCGRHQSRLLLLQPLHEHQDLVVNLTRGFFRGR